MATEKILVEISETGARIVKRNIEDVGKSAVNAAPLIDKFKSALAGVGIGFSLAHAIRELAQFETALNRVKVFAGFAGDELQVLRDAAREVGRTTEFSAVEAAKALEQLSKDGDSVTAVLTKLRATEHLASVGAIDLASSSDLLSRNLRAFAIQGDDATKIADALALAATKADVPVAALGAQLAAVGPKAKALGADFDEVTSALVVLNQAGLEGERAVSGLNQIISSLASPSADVRRELRNVGLTLEDIKIGSEGLVGALSTLRRAGLDADAAFRLFSRDGETAFSILTGQGLPAVRLFRDELAGASGEAGRTAAALRDDVGTQIRVLVNAVKDAELAFGELILKFGLTADNIRAIADEVRSLSSVIASIRTEIDRFVIRNAFGKDVLATTDQLRTAAERQREAIRTAPSPVPQAGPGATSAPLGSQPFEAAGPPVPSLTRATNELRDFNQELDRQIAMRRLSAEQVAVENAVTAQLLSLQAKGIDLSEEDTTNLAASLRLRIGMVQEIEQERAFMQELLIPHEQLNQQKQTLNQLLADGTISQDQFTLSMNQLLIKTIDAGDAFGGFATAFLKVDASAKALGETIGNSFVAAIDNASGALAAFAASGFRNTEDLRKAFSNLFSDLGQQILATVIKFLILKAVQSSLGSGSLLGGVLTTALGAATTTQGARAGGGPVVGGVPVVVGEHKPELFVPQQSGVVLNQQQLQSLGVGQQAPQVNVSPAPVNVAIVKDEKEALTAMGTDAGQQVIVSAIRQNRDSIKAMLS